MSNPTDRKYTKDHEWLKEDGDNYIIGITSYAQEELGDIVFVELPEAGSELSSGSSFGTIESVKAVSDIYAPISSVVVESNQALNDEPQLLNTDPFEKGWIVKVKASSLDGAELLEPSEYEDLISEISK